LRFLFFRHAVYLLLRTSLGHSNRTHVAIIAAQGLIVNPVTHVVEAKSEPGLVDLLEIDKSFVHVDMNEPNF
jgi:hypothetical protein